MGIFDRLKKKKMPTEKELSKSIDEFNYLWNMDIKEIWNIGNMNSFVIAMTGWVNRKCNYGENISVLTSEEKTVYIVNCFQAEVNNGGFDQFLFNCSGAFVGDLLYSLNTIGANRTAEIYKEALVNLPHELPVDDEQRDALLDELITEDISEVFASCDQQFYECHDNLEELLYQFIVENKGCFV